MDTPGGAFNLRRLFYRVSPPPFGNGQTYGIRQLSDSASPDAVTRPGFVLNPAKPFIGRFPRRERTADSHCPNDLPR